ncbi:MAG: hypothetical protein ACRCUS_00050 [Anaerovoracaceae bacterium]
MKKKIIILSIIVVIAVIGIICITQYIKSIPIPKDEYITTEMLIKHTTKILRKNGSHRSYSELLNDEREWLIDSSNENRSVMNKIGKDSPILELYYVGKGWNKDYLEPRELYSMFECFLFMRDRNIEEDIAAIICDVMSRGDYIDSGGVRSFVLISTSEFENLYGFIKDTNKSDEELAKELTELWLEGNLYNRADMEFAEKYNYRKKLITPYNEIVMSPNENFLLRFNYNNNHLYLDTTPKYKNIGSIKGIGFSIMPIEEKGYIYGMWDEYNNIWLCGETSGVLFLKYDGEENWEKEDPTGYEMPKELKQAVELANRIL